MEDQVKRFFWADGIRVIAIFLVIFLHLNTSLEKNIFNTVVNQITQISVPIFIILSGALLLEKKESFGKFLSKRFSKILLPWIFWTLIYFLWNIFSNNKPLSPDIFKDIYTIFFSGFWFLPLIASIYLFAPLIRVFIQNAKIKDIMLGIFLWFLYASVFPFFQLVIGSALPYNNSAVQYIGYFIAGVVLLKIMPTKRNILVLILAAIIVLISKYVFTFFAFGSTLDEYPYNFLSPFSVISSMTLFVLMFFAFNYLEKITPKILIKLFENLSKATLGIYLLHFLVIEMFYRNLSLQKLPVLISSLIIFFISFLVIYLCQKIPLLKKVIA